MGVQRPKMSFSVSDRRTLYRPHSFSSKPSTLYLWAFVLLECSSLLDHACLPAPTYTVSSLFAHPYCGCPAAFSGLLWPPALTCHTQPVHSRLLGVWRCLSLFKSKRYMLSPKYPGQNLTRGGGRCSSVNMQTSLTASPVSLGTRRRCI